MVSQRYLFATATATAIPAGSSLEGWQRFLQSEPLGTVSSDAEPRVSALDPVAQTLHHLVFNWMTGPLAVTCVTSGAAVLAFSTLAEVPPEPDCHHLSLWSSDRARVTCLEQAIAAGDLDAARQGLQWVRQWESNHPLASEQADLLAAGIALEQTATQPPSPKPVVAGAHVVPHFSEPVAQGDPRPGSMNEGYAEAHAALQRQDWATAFQQLWQLQAIAHNPDQLAQVRQLAQRLELERRATRLLGEARHLYASDTLQNQQQAIALTQQIARDSYVWQQSQPLLQHWQAEVQNRSTWTTVRKAVDQDIDAQAWRQAMEQFRDRTWEGTLTQFTQHLSPEDRHTPSF